MPCDWVLSTLPAQQAFDLLPPTLPSVRRLPQAQMRGCFSFMLGFGDALPIEFDAALVRERDISWISLNSSKPEGPKPASCSCTLPTYGQMRISKTIETGSRTTSVTKPAKLLATTCIQRSIRRFTAGAMPT